MVKFEQGIALRYSDATAFGFPTEVDADFILQTAKRMTAKVRTQGYRM